MIDCDLVVTKAIDVQLNPRECKKAKASFDHLPGIGIKSAKRVNFTDQKEAEVVSSPYLKSHQSSIY